jgi:hypothetical protein
MTIIKKICAGAASRRQQSSRPFLYHPMITSSTVYNRNTSLDYSCWYGRVIVTILIRAPQTITETDETPFCVTFARVLTVPADRVRPVIIYFFREIRERLKHVKNELRRSLVARTRRHTRNISAGFRYDPRVPQYRPLKSKERVRGVEIRNKFHDTLVTQIIYYR